MVLKTISPGCGVRASLMLFFFQFKVALFTYFRFHSGFQCVVWAVIPCQQFYSVSHKRTGHQGMCFLCMPLAKISFHGFTNHIGLVLHSPACEICLRLIERKINEASGYGYCFMFISWLI